MIKMWKLHGQTDGRTTGDQKSSFDLSAQVSSKTRKNLVTLINQYEIKLASIFSANMDKKLSWLLLDASRLNLIWILFKLAFSIKEHVFIYSIKIIEQDIIFMCATVYKWYNYLVSYEPTMSHVSLKFIDYLRLFLACFMRFDVWLLANVLIAQIEFVVKHMSYLTSY